MFKELVLQRHAVRSYRADVPVEEEKLAYVLECARWAPSAVNYQPWKFLVLQSAGAKESLYPCYDRPWIRDAPVVIVCCADHTRSWKRRADGKDHADIDVAIAVGHLCLAAAEQGLGTCWVCNFDAEGLKAAFRLPATMEPVALVPLGYPSDPGPAPAKERRALSDIVEVR